MTGAPKTAVITGGAGGLGQALSRALRGQGWQVALLDLPHALEALPLVAGETHHPCDVTDVQALTQTCATLRAQYPSLDLAIYNAGVTLIAPFEAVDADAHRRVFEINYWGAVNLAAALLPDIRRAGGTHLAITSVAGFAPLKHRTAYAASKHAMGGFFTSLRGEEAPHGVRVVLAAPSFVATNPGAGADANGLGRPGAAGDGIDEMSPDAAAQTILNGLSRGRDFVPVGRVAGLAWWINRLAPKFYERQMLKRIAGEET